MVPAAPLLPFVATTKSGVMLGGGDETGGADTSTAMVPVSVAPLGYPNLVDDGRGAGCWGVEHDVVSFNPRVPPVTWPSPLNIMLSPSASISLPRIRRSRRRGVPASAANGPSSAAAGAEFGGGAGGGGLASGTTICARAKAGPDESRLRNALPPASK